MRYFVFFLTVFLSGCASLYEPAPSSFIGPTALVSDACAAESRSKA